jgi:hypothetical protein
LTEENKKEEELSQSEVFSVLEFYSSLNRGIYDGILTPELINQRLSQINLNPRAGTQSEIEDALAHPSTSEMALQAFSENFELVSQPYKRLISYCSNMLAFDLTYSCINAEEGDYTSIKYKKDFQIVKNFFDRLDYKKEFNIAVREMLRNEAFIFCPRFDGDKIILQELPNTFTKITGRWDFGLSASLDMIWFLQPGVSLSGYSDFFRKRYNDLWGSGTTQSYKPMIAPELRGSSSWVYIQDLPPDQGWVLKLTPEISTRCPYWAGLFLDLLSQDMMRNLQKNINMSTANRLVVGEIALLKESATKVKDAFSISATNLGQFLSLVKSAVGESLKVSALPLQNVQGLQFPPVNDMYQSYLSTMLASSGVSTDLLFTGNVRPNVMATQLSLNVDEQLMETLYPQFANFLNYFVNKQTKHFKFKFEFEGTKFFNNRQQRFDRQMQLVDRGIILPNRIAASMGIDPFTFQREMEEAKANKFVEKLTPIVPVVPPGQGGGRPQKPDSELSQEGSDSRASGGNIEKGGKI